MTRRIIFILSFIIFNLSIGLTQKSPNANIESHIKEIFKVINSGDPMSARAQAIRYLNENDTLDCQQKGRLNKIIGISYRDVRDYKSSVSWFNDNVLTIWNACDSLPKKYLVEPHLTLAECWGQLNDYNKVIHHANKVFELYNNGNGKGPYYEVRAYLIAGRAYSLLGDALLAEKYFIKASNIIDNFTDEYTITYFRYLLVNYRSIHNMDYGQFTRAISDFNEGIDLSKALYSEEELSENYLDEFIMRNNLVKCYIQMSDFNKAKDQISLIRSFGNELKFDIARAEYLMNKMEILLSEKNSAQIYTILKDTAFSELDLSFTARLNLLKARVNLIDENGNQTETYFQKAINNLVLNTDLNFDENKFSLEGNRIYNYEVMYDVLISYYNWKKSIHESTESIESYNELRNIFNQLDYLISSSRSSYLSESSRINQLEFNYNIYEDMISFLVASNDASKIKLALLYCMKNKGNELNHNFDLKRGLNKIQNAEEISKTTDFENEIRNLEYEFATLADNFQKDSVNTLYLQKLKEYEQIKLSSNTDGSLNNKEGSYVINDNSISEIQAKLLPNEILIEVFYGQDQIFIFGLSTTSCNVHSVDRTSKIDASIKALNKSLVEGGDLNIYKALSSEFNQVFFNSILNQFEKDISKVYIVPDGEMYQIPFDALWDGQRFNIEKYSVSMLYNSKMILNDKSSLFNNSYLGYGTSYTDKLNENISRESGIKDIRLARLSNAEIEIEESKALFNGESKLNANASLSDFSQNFEYQNGILHFALHGIILDQFSSAIAFDDNEDDFLLRSTDVYGLELNNYLSVLSACHSSDGKIYAGDGVHSLARSFLFAGSENVISSLWAASDQANSKIMTSFFEQMKDGNNLPESLANAKRKYISNSSPALQHPSYWGNMVLIGIGENEPNNFPFWAIGLICLAVLSFLYFRFKKR